MAERVERHAVLDRLPAFFRPYRSSAASTTAGRTRRKSCGLPPRGPWEEVLSREPRPLEPGLDDGERRALERPVEPVAVRRKIGPAGPAGTRRGGGAGEAQDVREDVVGGGRR